MSYKIRNFYKVKKDLDSIDIPRTLIIKKFIETKLSKKPAHFGKTLVGDLKNFRSSRISNYRIIYKVTKKTITIFAIGHRKEIYEKAKRRLFD